ncbi:MAG: RecX family transcriptional regulator [Bryobacterales bacterium]|nr:RecX family transcriptional regulator [Bryobacterales bacterium]
MPIRPPRKLTSTELWDYALSALSRRALSSGELRVKLERRAENRDDIPPILARLKESKYLDDTRFAESYAEARLHSGGLGRQRVVRDLRARRVAPGLAEQAVTNAYDGTDEVALIEDFLARKYRNKNLPQMLNDERELASVFRKLRYAGFSAGNAIRVLKRYSRQADELEGEEEGIEREAGAEE